jgi:hypothetical protein
VESKLTVSDPKFPMPQALLVAHRRRLSIASRCYWLLLVAFALAGFVGNWLRVEWPVLGALLAIAVGIAWVAAAFWFGFVVFKVAPSLGAGIFWGLGTVFGGPIGAAVFSARADLHLDSRANG